MSVIQWTKNWADQTQNPYQFFQSLSSSNTKAQTLSLIKNQTLLILANHQTEPYGRNSKKWVPSDFMATWTWNQKIPIYNVTAPRIGLLFYNAFYSVWPSSYWALKAPNDIYYKNNKVSGILLETLTKEQGYQIILGVGINVLKAPLLTSTNISAHLSVNEALWNQFLDILNQKLNALKNQNKKTLSSDERDQLLQILKKYLHHKTLESIDANGNLIFPDRSIQWIDL